MVLKLCVLDFFVGVRLIVLEFGYFDLLARDLCFGFSMALSFCFLSAGDF